MDILFGFEQLYYNNKANFIMIIKHLFQLLFFSKAIFVNISPRYRLCFRLCSIHNTHIKPTPEFESMLANLMTILLRSLSHSNWLKDGYLRNLGKENCGNSGKSHCPCVQGRRASNTSNYEQAGQISKFDQLIFV